MREFGTEQADLLGTTKLSRGASSEIWALGKTKAPVLISCMLGLLGEAGLDVKTTFAKWVGTETFGGEPITSCVYNVEIELNEEGWEDRNVRYGICHRSRAWAGIMGR
jgi:hypothetical protein